MWYFTWILGVSLAVLLAILSTLWGEHEEERLASNLPEPDATPTLIPGVAENKANR